MSTSRKRNKNKMTAKAKVMVTAVTITGLLGTWNTIGHIEAKQSNTTPLPEPSAFVLPTNSSPATPWPTINPLQSAAPIPTLPTYNQQTNGLNLTGVGDPAFNSQLPAINPVSIPTLAPLPPMPQLQLPPPPPPPQPVQPRNQSSGSG